MNNNIIVLVVAAGLAVGVLTGIVTRPTHFGIDTPLSVMFSSYPADAMFRSELTQHLALTGTIGLIVGGALAAILAFVKKA